MTPSLTQAQRDVLRAAVLADPTIGGLDYVGTADNDQTAADWLNAIASPDFILWKQAVTRHEIQVDTSEQGTTFTWGGTAGGYINRSQGERDAWKELFNQTGSVDPSMPNVQTAFADIFSGTGAGAVNNRAHIANMCRRRASRAEKLLAVGTGSVASPAKATSQGQVTVLEAGLIMRGA